MSEADSNWFLRHRDGVEHGPFRLADIINAARAGNIATDTCVRHEVHTRGQWVLATRLQPIAEVIRKAEPSPAPRTGPSPRQQPPPQSSAPQPSAPATPGVRGAQAAGGTSAAMSTAIETPGAPVAATADIGSATSIRVHSSETFPVPKTFLRAAETLLVDFRFRRFITPWIVKILWAISLALAGLSTLKLGYEFFVQPSMPAPGPVTGQGNWQFEPIADQPFLQLRIITFLIWTALTLGIILVLRVICELAIVFFHVSGDVVELRQFLKGRKSS